MPLNNSIFEKVKGTFTTYLETKELRKTPERYAILEEIYSQTGHFDVESLFDKMKSNNYRVSRATVYNTLDLLVDCFFFCFDDLKNRIQFSDHQKFFNAIGGVH